MVGVHYRIICIYIMYVIAKIDYIITSMVIPQQSSD